MDWLLFSCQASGWFLGSAIIGRTILGSGCYLRSLTGFSIHVSLFPFFGSLTGGRTRRVSQSSPLPNFYFPLLQLRQVIQSPWFPNVKYFLLLLLVLPASAQIVGRGAPPPGPPGPVPLLSDGKPDLSGVWNGQRIVKQDGPYMLPWAEKLVAQRATTSY